MIPKIPSNTYTSLILLLIVISIFSCTKSTSGSGVVKSIDAEKVFTDFTMTKEIKFSFENLVNKHKNELDSIAAIITVMQRDNNPEFKYVREHYLSKQNKYMQEEQALSEKYDEEVWLRIRSYAREYCESRGIKQLHGLTKSSEVLYMSPEVNVTEDFLKFINSSYAGIEK